MTTRSAGGALTRFNLASNDSTSACTRTGLWLSLGTDSLKEAIPASISWMTSASLSRNSVTDGICRRPFNAHCPVLSRAHLAKRLLFAVGSCSSRDCWISARSFFSQRTSSRCMFRGVRLWTGLCIRQLISGITSSHQWMTARCSRPESGVDFTRVTNTANSFRSEPIARRPWTIASTTVVPPPMYGSSTVSPGRENRSMQARAKEGENRAGYL